MLYYDGNKWKKKKCNGHEIFMEIKVNSSSWTWDDTAEGRVNQEVNRLTLCVLFL